MKADIHTIIEMIKGDPRAISLKFGIPLPTVYNWCSGMRQPPDYVICMMMNIILLERRLKDVKADGLESGMGEDPGRIKKAGEESQSET